MLTQFIKELISLPHFTVQNQRKEGKSWLFELQPLPIFHPCPVCSGDTIRFCSHPRRLMHGFAMNIGIIWIEIPRERRSCKECGATFTVQYRDIPERGIATEAFRRFIVQQCHGRTISDVTRRFGLKYTTVERWFYQIAPAQLQDPKPKAVCVDDFALRKGHSYGIAVLDAKTGHVLDVAEGKKEESIRNVLHQTAEMAHFIVSDVAPAMAKAIQNACPNAIHVLDRFHVVQFFTEALDRRRKYLSKGGTKHGQVRQVVRMLSQLPNELTEEERNTVFQWCHEDAELRHIYQALQHLRFVFKSWTIRMAEQRVQQWFDRFTFGASAVVRKIAKTLLIRRNAFLACVIYPYSNGIMEGTNNKIKLIKRRAYGYRNMERFKWRIRLETGRLFKYVNYNLW